MNVFEDYRQVFEVNSCTNAFYCSQVNCNHMANILKIFITIVKKAGAVYIHTTLAKSLISPPKKNHKNTPIWKSLYSTTTMHHRFQDAFLFESLVVWGWFQTCDFRSHKQMVFIANLNGSIPKSEFKFDFYSADRFWFKNVQNAYGKEKTEKYSVVFVTAHLMNIHFFSYSKRPNVYFLVT